MINFVGCTVFCSGASKVGKYVPSCADWQNLFNFESFWAENGASYEVDHGNQNMFEMAFLINCISMNSLYNPF